MQSCFSLSPPHHPAPLIPHLPRILRLDEVPDQILGIQGWDNQGGAALDIKEPSPRALCSGGVHRMRLEHRGGCLIQQGEGGAGSSRLHWEGGT